MTTSATYEALRRSTRLRFAVPLRVTSLDPAFPFAQDCRTIVVNAHGCAIDCPLRLREGLRIRLDLQRGITALGTIVGTGAKIETGWMIGIALDRPGNVWGVSPPPVDWAATPDDSRGYVSDTTDADRKLSVWPMAGPTTSLPPAQMAESAVLHLEGALRERAQAIACEYEEQYKKSFGDLLLRLRADLGNDCAADIAKIRQEVEDDLRQLTKHLSGHLVDSSENTKQSLLGELSHVGTERVRQIISDACVQLLPDIGSTLAAQVRAEYRSTIEQNLDSLEQMVGSAVDTKIDVLARDLQTSLQQRMERYVANYMEQQLSTTRGMARTLAEEVTVEFRQQAFEAFDARERDFLNLIGVRLQELRASESNLESRIVDVTSRIATDRARTIVDLKQATESLQGTAQAHRQNVEDLCNSAIQEMSLKADSIHAEFQVNESQLAVQRQNALQRAQADADQVVEQVRNAAEQYRQQLANVAAEREQRLRTLLEEDLHGLNKLKCEVEQMQQEFRRGAKERLDSAALVAEGEQRLRTLLGELDGFRNLKGEMEQMQQEFRTGAQERLDSVALVAESEQRLKTLLGELDGFKSLKGEMEQTQQRSRHAAQEQLDGLSKLAEDGERKLTTVLAEFAAFQDLKDEMQKVQLEFRHTTKEGLDSATELAEKVERAHKWLEVVGKELEQTASDAQCQFELSLSEFMRAARTSLEEGAATALVLLRTQSAEHHDRLTSGAQAVVSQQLEQLNKNAAAETERYRSLVHDTMLECSGEIRGRVQLAIEQGCDTLSQRARREDQVLDATATKLNEQLHQVSAELCDGFKQSLDAEGDRVARAVQEQTANFVAELRNQTQALVQESASKLQLALSDVITSLPEMLKQKLNS